MKFSTYTALVTEKRTLPTVEGDTILVREVTGTAYPIDICVRPADFSLTRKEAEDLVRALNYVLGASPPATAKERAEAAGWAQDKEGDWFDPASPDPVKHWRVVPYYSGGNTHDYAAYDFRGRSVGIYPTREEALEAALTAAGL